MYTELELQLTAFSHHFRITKKYDVQLYIDAVKAYAEEYAIFEEKIGEENHHYHCWIHLNKKETSLRRHIQIHLPMNKGGTGYHLAKTKANDYRNLCYCVKEGNEVATTLSPELIKAAMRDSFVKETKATARAKSNSRWKDAKDLFDKTFKIKDGGGIKEKDYDELDILKFCVEFYGNDSPFAEEHVYRLYNYLSMNSKYEQRTKNRIVRSVSVKYNLDL